MSSKKVAGEGVFFVGWKEIATPCGLAMTEATTLRPHGVAPTGNIARPSRPCFFCFSIQEIGLY